ncbi:hypothetical protein LLG95_13500 [bacterium]|nr:hypothetical protein [bacterium]
MKATICTAAILLFISIAAPAMAADNAMFDYQGRVLVQGIPYTGTGQMKVAIVAGTSPLFSLWSNDGTSVAGSEPTGSFSISVVGGVFNALIGDTNIMDAIPTIMFNRDDELKVRVWFNDGSHGFQLLTPDRRLTNPRRLGITEAQTTTTLYVNTSTGDDLNSGLSATTAKKTIQAAVSMVPSRVFNNFTIRVATGVYRESVKINNIHAASPARFLIVGDETTVPSDSASPSVRLTGTDNDSTHAIARSIGFTLDGCGEVEVKGFLIDYYGYCGANVTGGHVYLTKCKATNVTNGFNTAPSTWVQFANCWARYCSTGYGANGGSAMDLISCGVTDCTSYGALAQANCTIGLYGNCTFSRNSYALGCWQYSSAWFVDGAHSITNNTNGVNLQMESLTRIISRVTFSGNGTNTIVSSDSHAY